MTRTLDCDLWVIEPTALRRLTALALSGACPIDLPDFESRVSAGTAPSKQKAIGLIRIHGALEARPTEVGQWLGMSSYEQIGVQFDALMADSTVSSVVLDVMSPGGMVYGASELANKIYQARGQKPVIAVANPMAASGAYWVAAAADRIVSLPSADTGSVGVIWEHADVSESYQQQGVKFTTIRSKNSPYKAEGNDVEPLSDQARAHMQSRADEIYDKFVSDLSRFRGKPVEHINEHFGKGRVVDSRRALAAGMIDRIDSLQGIVSKLHEGRIKLGSTSAMDAWDAPTVQELRQAKVERFRALSISPGEV